MKNNYLLFLIYLLIFLSILPFLTLFEATAVRGSFAASFANIAGLVGAVLLLWQLILSNRFIMRRVTPDYISSVKLHIFLGVYGFFFVFTHPILEMLSYGQGLVFLLVPQIFTEFGRHVSLGQGAFYLYLIVWLSSAIWRDKISYRVWRYVHYLGAPVLLLVFLHAREIGSYLQSYLWLELYWYFLMGVYLVYGVFRATQFFLNYGRKAYRLVDKESNDSGVTTFVLEPAGINKQPLAPEIGQFCFIKLDLMSESHPFTVMNYDQQSEQLSFGVKEVGMYTNQLAKTKVGQTLYVDGPYGVFTQEAQNDEPKVIIAGGIGVTPFVDLVSNYANEQTYMFNANRYLSDAVHRSLFVKKLGKRYVDLISRENLKDEQVFNGRINQQVIADTLPTEILQEARFFVCGSPGFTDKVLQTLQSLEVDQERIYWEEFSF